MDNLEDLIVDAKQVRKEMEAEEQYKKEIAEEVNYMVRKISEAKSKNENHTCFNVSKKHEDVIKNMFKAKNYTFKPTGEIGGVWQKSEEICW